MTVEPAPTLSRADAERLTSRIRSVAGNARESMSKLYVLVEQARTGSAWESLGFPSWTAYLVDALGGQPIHLPRAERRELVDYLAGEGVSVPAIASMAGVSDRTVQRDFRQVVTDVTTSPDPVGVDGGEAVTPTAPSPVTVRDDAPADAPASAVELRETGVSAPPAPRTVTGLDGKAYARPVQPVPDPVEAYLAKDAEIVRLRVARVVLSVLRKSSDLMLYPASDVADALDDGDLDTLDRHLTSLTAWVQAIHSARRAGLHLVKG